MNSNRDPMKNNHPKEVKQKSTPQVNQLSLRNTYQQSIRRRVLINKFFSYSLFSLSFIAIIPLFLIIAQVFFKGIRKINLDLFFNSQPPPNSGDGGVLNAIVGSLLILLIAMILSVPISVMGAVYVSENKKKKIADFIYSSCNILQSVPAIIIGIVIYSWVVKPMGGFNLLSGGIALACMMLPYVMINTIEILGLIPISIKEAGYALGGSYFKVIYKIVLPVALPGIFNGIFIALGRVVGEAAPLFFTAFGNPYLSLNLFEPVASLPLIIFQFSISPYENWKEIGWGASFILLAGIMLTNFISKKFSKNYNK